MAKITPRPQRGKRLTAAIGLALLFGFAAAFSSGPVRAYELQVAGSADPGGSGPYLLGLGASSFDITDDSAYATNGTLYIIVGTVNGTAAPTISFGGQTLTPTLADGNFAITGTSGAYQAAGFTSVADTTNNGSAWASFDRNPAVGADPTSAFDLYTYEITSSSSIIGAGGSIQLGLANALPGDVLLGYSCISGQSMGASGCPAGDGMTSQFALGATPSAGVVDVPVPAPEPGSLALFATGLVWIGGAGYRRRRSARMLS